MPVITQENVGHWNAASLDLPLVQAPDAGDDTGEIRSQRLWTSSDETQRHGIWQMSPGVLEGAKGPETVYIIEGRATVTVEPAAATVELKAGDVFIFESGQTARWHIHEALRKFFVINQ